MPTTKFKNLLYRGFIRFSPTDCGRRPLSGIIGRNPVHERSFIRLIRRHHVLGSATLLSSGEEQTILLTSSVSPVHAAETDSYFRVASITKMATSALALHLSEKQILDPDMPLSGFFDLPCGSCLEHISLRHLLSHTSGLIDPPNLEQSLENGIPFPDLLPSASGVQPGSSFHYSNLGFGLIGCVFEAILNMPLGAIFDHYLFSPLGMKATLEGCLLPPGKIMPVTRILPYRKGSDLILTPLGTRPLTRPDPMKHYGHSAGSMYSDIASLRILLREISGQDSRILSSYSVKEMKKTHACYGKISPTLSYGLGLLRIDDARISDGPVFGHQGFAYGCADGAFWEEKTGRMFITLNGGCSEARTGRLGLANSDMMRWAFRKEMPSW